MTKLVAGMDVSGNPMHGNYKYLAIVIGIEKNILDIYKQLGSKQIHMSEIKNKKKSAKNFFCYNI